MTEFETFKGDPEGFRIAQGYAGADFNKARTVTHEVFASYSGTWTPEAFQEEIAAAIASIPKEFMPTAKVEMDGDEYSHLFITYVGPEDHQTVLDRIRRCEQHVEGHRMSERTQYERLKGNGPVK